MNDTFDIPIVIFLYKRKDKLLNVLEVIKKIKPSKIYLLGDGPSNDSDALMINETRNAVLNFIDWDTTVVTRFSDKNIGVYENIGLGACWVFEREHKAIFIEDDNLPSLSFFKYCEEMLQKYENEPKILWVCGTNYLGKYNPPNNTDIIFTKHMMPCGWASWSNKFLRYYDKDFSLFHDKTIRKRVKKSYLTHGLYTQRCRSIKREIYRKQHNKRYISWDFHMIFSIRGNDLYGIAPKYNLIKNIGVDSFSVHSTKKDKKNNNCFCGVDNYELSFPLKTPNEIKLDVTFEKRIGKIIRHPFYIRAAFPLTNLFKIIFHKEPYN